MAAITDIKRQKREEDRFSVYVDNKYSFSLTDLELSTSGLRIGQELDQEQVDGWQKHGVAGKAFALAARYTSLRPRSRMEVRNYLRRRGFSQEELASALVKLEDVGLINDREFAAAWIANRLALRPRSRHRLTQELSAKGIVREDQEAALSALGEDDELDSLMSVIEKKRRLPQYREPERLKAYLARQGYSFDLVRSAFERLESD